MKGNLFEPTTAEYSAIQDASRLASRIADNMFFEQGDWGPLPRHVPHSFGRDYYKDGKYFYGINDMKGRKWHHEQGR